MIIGAHSIVYSASPEADRAFLRDVLNLPSVDVGEGWLIFGLPPAEVAVHPAEENDVHELYFMCDDVGSFVAEMQTRGIACEPVQNQGWGLLTQVRLPGGGKIGVYQPRHPRPGPISLGRSAAGKGRTRGRKKAGRTAAARKGARKKAAGGKAAGKRAVGKKAARRKTAARRKR